MIYLENDEVDLFGKKECPRKRYGYTGMYIIINNKKYFVQRADANGYYAIEVGGDSGGE
jgi:hypothetical protein